MKKKITNHKTKQTVTSKNWFIYNHFAVATNFFFVIIANLRKMHLFFLYYFLVKIIICPFSAHQTGKRLFNKTNDNGDDEINMAELQFISNYREL
jgi:hypothetical protein